MQITLPCPLYATLRPYPDLLTFSSYPLIWSPF